MQAEITVSKETSKCFASQVTGDLVLGDDDKLKNGYSLNKPWKTSIRASTR